MLLVGAATVAIEESPLPVRVLGQTVRDRRPVHWDPESLLAGTADLGYTHWVRGVIEHSDDGLLDQTGPLSWWGLRFFVLTKPLQQSAFQDRELGSLKEYFTVRECSV
jgi:hypothetical protein